MCWENFSLSRKSFILSFNLNVYSFPAQPNGQNNRCAADLAIHDQLLTSTRGHIQMQLIDLSAVGATKIIKFFQAHI